MNRTGDQCNHPSLRWEPLALTHIHVNVIKSIFLFKHGIQIGVFEDAN